MSSKNPPKDPRIAPKEMIVTRRKSAQQKRQLREIDRSMKSITQLLKSPIRSTSSPKKPKISPKKAKKKKNFIVQLVQKPAKKESPKPTQRKQKTERVWLKPKHNFTMVARTNKRKLCTPQREMDPSIAQLLLSPGSPSPDMTQLMDETDSLDDEDLMEILTCPSPVWWEDPPHPHYSEEAICTRSPSFQLDPETKPANTTTENVTDKQSTKAYDKKDPKFMKKLNKLENILGNIKNKKNIQNDDEYKSDVDCDLLNDEMLKTLESMDIPIEPESNKAYTKKDEIDAKDIKKLSNEVTVKNEDELNKINKVEKKIKKEVMPVKVPEDMPPLLRNPMHPDSILAKQKSSRRKTAYKVLINNEISKNSSQTSTKTDLQNLHNTSDVLEKDQVIKDELLDNNEIKDKSLTDNNEIRTLNSPEFEKKDSKDLDTISDTNIKFIDKVEDKELDDTSQMILEKIKRFFQEKEKKKKQEYITVYKIVDNEEKYEITNEDRSKINHFYKKCKNVRRKNDSKEVKENSTKTLELPNSQVKYCFTCSSIFETKECHYCAMTEVPTDCDCDKSHDNRSDLSGENCDTDRSVCKNK